MDWAAFVLGMMTMFILEVIVSIALILWDDRKNERK